MARSYKEQEEIKKWRGRIKIAQEKRDQMNEKVWEKNVKAYRGELKPSPLVWSESDPWVSIELVHSSIRASIPSLLYNRPKWTITPRRPIRDPQGNDISWERADVVSQWLDQIWKETCGNEHIRLSIIAAYLAFGAVKVGYAPTFADDDCRGEYEYDENGDIKIDYTDSEGNQIPKLAKGEFLLDKNGNMVIDEDSGFPILHPGEIQREEFFVEWVPWMNLLFDPEGGNVFRAHRYVIEEWVRPLEDVHEDPRYRPSRKDVVATSKLSNEREGIGRYEEFEPGKSTMGTVDMDQQRVRGWDIYDFEHNRMLVLIDGEENDEFLMDIEMPEGIDHGPFVFLKFNEDPGEFYPRTDAEAMAKVELEYNLTRSQMATHRNQSRARYAEVRGAGFDGDEDGGTLERTKFQTGPSGTVVKVKSAEGIVPMRKDALDGSFFQTMPNIRMDFAEMAGQGGEARGVADADTATQASLVAASADVRNNDRRDNLVQTFLSEIGRKLIQAGQAHAECIQWIKITGDENAPRPFTFMQVNHLDLIGEFDVDVAMGSTQPMNTSSRVAMYTQIVTMLSQNPVIMASPTLMRRLFEAIDLRDEGLIKEIMDIGKQAVQGMNPPQEGAVAPPTQGLGDIANQFLQAHNTMQGAPTGAPTR